MDRQRAHQLLDQLDAAQFDAVVRLLEAMVEPLARSLALARVEEEEITPETAAALDRARAIKGPRFQTTGQAMAKAAGSPV